MYPKYNKNRHIEICEEYEVPTTTESLSALLIEILDKSFERLSLEKGSVLKVFRLEEYDPLGEEITKLSQTIQKSIIEEPELSSDTPFAQVAKALYILTQNSRHGVCWVLGSSSDFLIKWLSCSLTLNTASLMSDQFMGLPIYYDTTLPDETLLLAGAASRDSSITDIDFLVKLSMDVLSHTNSTESAPVFGGF